jgi:hypothetical protein
MMACQEDSLEYHAARWSGHEVDEQSTPIRSRIGEGIDSLITERFPLLGNRQKLVCASNTSTARHASAPPSTSIRILRRTI